MKFVFIGIANSKETVDKLKERIEEINEKCFSIQLTDVKQGCIELYTDIANLTPLPYTEFEQRLDNFIKIVNSVVEFVWTDNVYIIIERVAGKSNINYSM